jgi:membrane associated rhomboid family serine protease
VIPLRDDNPTRRFAVATLVIVALNIAVFAFQLALPRWGLTLQSWYYAAGARPFELTHGVDLPPGGFIPWWATLFTSLFVHGGWLHLIFNMVYLWIFGNNVEDVMTRPRFVAFYVICGLLATAAQVLVDTRTGVPLIGASGAIAGVLGAYLVLFPRARVLTVVPLLLIFPVVSVPAWALLGFWFLLQALQGALAPPGGGDVAFYAHVGGFVAGMILVCAFARPSHGSLRLRS